MNPQEFVKRVLQSSEERDRVMTELYTGKSLREIVSHFVLRNGGTNQDVETILTDAIINFVKNCYKKDFFIRSTLENYFFGVTKNLWYRTIRKNKQKEVSEDVSEMVDDQRPDILLLDEERRHLLGKILDQLDEKCREVLTLWAKSMKMQDIAVELNYSSPEVVRKKKHFCLKRLIELVDKYPEYLQSLKQES